MEYALIRLLCHPWPFVYIFDYGIQLGGLSSERCLSSKDVDFFILD